MSPTAQSRLKKLQPLAEKLIGWVLVTIITLLTTQAVLRTKVEALESWKSQHENEQRTNQITRPEFNQFKDDLNQRLDDQTNRLGRIETLLMNEHRTNK